MLIRKQILFVDDDLNVLQGLQRMLHSQRSIWDMSFVTSGREALELLSRKNFNIVISDMRMPDMDGVELLTSVMKRYPHTVRFILSGQTSKEALVKAIGPTHQFLSKPCDADYLKKAIERALNLRNMLKDENLISIISRIKSLPSLPILYLQLEKEIKSPMCSIQTVADIIRQDVAMSAKILHLVNTAFYGFRQQISDISQAVKMMGLETIQSLVFVAQVFSGYQGKEHLTPFLDMLWKHSMNVCSLSRNIAKSIRRDSFFQDIAFKSGLFHDFGKLILITKLPDIFVEILRLIKEKNIDFWKAELEILGTSHAEIGAYLLGLWGFTDSIVEAVAYHHRPGMSKSENIDSITSVHIANALEYEETPQGSSYEEENDKLDLDYLRSLQIESRLPEWREIHLNTVLRRDNGR
ncbi:MAG: HDOD domain-containing protein [Vulcanimicrobiota bacterium]